MQLILVDNSNHLIQVRTSLLTCRMVPRSLECMHLVILCLEFPSPHFMVVPHSRMQFQLVELYMDQLVLFLMFLNQEVGVSGQGVEMQVLLLVVSFQISKALSKILETLVPLLTFLVWRVPIANHQLVVHCLSLGLLTMCVFSLPPSLSTLRVTLCTKVSLFVQPIDACSATYSNISRWVLHGRNFSGTYWWMICLALPCLSMIFFSEVILMITIRTSWAMTLKARDHMFHIMSLISPLRYLSART